MRDRPGQSLALWVLVGAGITQGESLVVARHMAAGTQQPLGCHGHDVVRSELASAGEAITIRVVTRGGRMRKRAAVGACYHRGPNLYVPLSYERRVYANCMLILSTKTLSPESGATPPLPLVRREIRMEIRLPAPPSAISADG